MAKTTPEAESAPTAAPVAPLLALCKIVYGDDQHAPAMSFFSPVSEDEREELLDLDGVVRELDETEKLVAAAMGLGVTPATDSDFGS